jgi:ariadne-1
VFDDDDEDMELDGFNDDFKVGAGSKRKAHEIEYASLSQQDVEQMMKADVDHICGILGVDVRVLFVYFVLYILYIYY